MKTISVVINARLGSSRVKNKLMRPFGDSSLIEIALAKLATLDFFEHRFLAVAEPELAALAAPYPSVRILKRSPAAVKPGVNPQPVTFAHYREVPSDYIFVMNPCLPFLSPETIKRAFDYFQQTQHPSYTSAIQTRDWIFDDEGRALTNSDPSNVTTNLGKAFFKAAHAFHIVDKAFFLAHGYHWTFQKNDPHLIEIPEAESIDVDTEIEFDFARFVYDKRKA
jgi:CMP-N-acetylneuraminic acid synthetase